jgi:hypothetical protein
MVIGAMETKRTVNPYPAELRERAVRMVRERAREPASEWAAMRSVASKVGCSNATAVEKKDTEAHTPHVLESSPGRDSTQGPLQRSPCDLVPGIRPAARRPILGRKQSGNDCGHAG